MNNVYIGSRYVPKLCGDWNDIDSYEPLSIVIYGNNSYTSKQSVPAGIVPTNTTYWALTGNYNGQISHLEEEIEDIRNAGIVDCENPPQSLSPLVPGLDFDNTNRLQDLIDYCASNKKILMLHNIYGVSGTIKLSSNITIIGTGGDYSFRDTEGALTHASSVIARIGNNTNPVIMTDELTTTCGIHLENIGICGNNVATIGLRVSRNVHSSFSNMSITDINGYGLYLYPDASTTPNDNIMFDTFSHIFIDRCYDGIFIGHSNSGNCCYNYFEAIRVDFYHIAGLFNGGDNNVFIQLSCYGRGSEVEQYPWTFDGNEFVSNVFYHLTGRPHAINGSVNSIYEYDMENNEGAPVIDSTSKLFYTCNSRNGIGIRNENPIYNVMIPMSSCNGIAPGYYDVNDKFVQMRSPVGGLISIGIDDTRRTAAVYFSGDGSPSEKIIEFNGHSVYLDGHKITYSKIGAFNDGDICLSSDIGTDMCIGEVYYNGAFRKFGALIP